MGAAYKNFWSLNTDEAVVTGILRSELPKGYEVLMPMNAQMKGIDLVVLNLKNMKVCTIQVKGSRAYEPSKKDVIRYKNGSVGWFFLNEKTIKEANADFYIFLVYVIEEIGESGRRIIKPHTIVIPTYKIQEFTKNNKKLTGGRYSYYFWVNPKSNESFDIRDDKYFVSEYLNKSGYRKLIDSIS